MPKRKARSRAPKSPGAVEPAAAVVAPSPGVAGRPQTAPEAFPADEDDDRCTCGHDYIEHDYAGCLDLSCACQGFRRTGEPEDDDGED